MQLVDIGVNLAHDSFDADREAVIARARAAGVVQLVITGSSLESTRRAIALAQAAPGQRRATAGVHPHHASELGPEARTALEALVQAPEVAAVGECGLDYYRDYSPRDAQRRAFEWQLELAARVGKPVFLHQRDAHEDFTAILRAHRPRLHGAVAHCFTGDAAQLEAYLELDLAIGITGWICDERRGAHLHEIMRLIPATRLMLETDAPYLLPRTLVPRPPSRRNEPAYLPLVAQSVARARGESLERLAAQTTATSRAFFQLPALE